MLVTTPDGSAVMMSDMRGTGERASGDMASGEEMDPGKNKTPRVSVRK